MMSIIEAIHARHSVRTYLPETPPASLLAQLKARIAGPVSVYGTRTARIALIQKSISGKIGTYGVIAGAQCYLALIYTAETEADNINAGMAMEQQVLWLTQHGMGSCWLAATFSRNDIADSVELQNGETIAALVPFGLPAARERLGARLMKRIVRSSTRKPFDNLFQIPPSSVFRNALALMRLAPSGLNRQPWRAVEQSAQPGTIHFYTQADSASDLLNLGIGLAHFLAGAPAGKFVRETAADTLLPQAHYAVSFMTE